jgi:ubiquinone/menaquinone biosynthesis C-methylase UbiE
MPKRKTYIMEHPEEVIRLELKTDVKALRQQARWCGIKPGMRVLDVGCGAGKTTSIINQIVQPGGNVIGIDYSAERVAYARNHYGNDGVSFYNRDFMRPMRGIGSFDVIWVRFILEYFRQDAFSIVKNLQRYLKPGGWLCLIDLDYNCLNHYELPTLMEEMLQKMMRFMEINFNFDPYAGRKLYAYLFDLSLEDIKAHVLAHHLFYGKLALPNLYNWMKKLEVNASRISGLFQDYPGGFVSFMEDFSSFFMSERRFTYTPMILCKGRKSLKS